MPFFGWVLSHCFINLPVNHGPSAHPRPKRSPACRDVNPSPYRRSARRFPTSCGCLTKACGFRPRRWPCAAAHQPEISRWRIEEKSAIDSSSSVGGMLRIEPLGFVPLDRRMCGAMQKFSGCRLSWLLQPYRACCRVIGPRGRLCHPVKVALRAARGLPRGVRTPPCERAEAVAGAASSIELPVPGCPVGRR